MRLLTVSAYTLALSFLFPAANSYAQEIPKYQMTYQIWVYIPESLPVKNSGKVNKMPGSDTTSSDKVIAGLPATAHSFAEIDVKGNSSRIVQITRLSPGNKTSSASRPDSVVFENGYSYVYISGVSEGKPVKPWKDSIQKTPVTKQLLGYTCTRYEWFDETRNRKAYVWSTSQLPAFLSPLGNNHFPGAVLEVNYFLPVKSDVIATRLKKID